MISFDRLVMLGAMRSLSLRMGVIKNHKKMMKRMAGIETVITGRIINESNQPTACKIIQYTHGRGSSCSRRVDPLTTDIIGSKDTVGIADTRQLTKTDE
jgi:hypothetical protein